MNRVLKPIFFAFFICLYGWLGAQRYPYTTVTNKDGLPQSSVFKIVQDHQGYIWFATEAGICRYDGYDFKSYSYFSGLDANFIFDAEIDRQGRLWIGSFGTGVAVFNGHSFYSFNESKGFPANFVIDMYFSEAGDLWVASKDKGIIRISMDYKPSIHTYAETGENFFGQMIDELPNGDIVGCGIKGIYLFNKEKYYKPELISDRVSLAVYVDDEGGIWSGGNNSLLYIKDTLIVDRSNWLPVQTDVWSITEPGNDGVIYIATENGLLKIDGDNRTWLTTANGLSYNLLQDVIKDNFGNIWVSTYGNGATILNDRGMTHYDVDGEGGDLCAFSIGEEKNGKIWVGKYYGGYYEITDSGIIKTKLPIPPDANPLQSLTDKEGNVYLLSNTSVVYKITDGKVVWEFYIPYPKEVVFGILKLHNGKMLIVGSFGCIEVDESTKKYRLIESTKDIFMKEPFYDEYGKIWLHGELGQIYQLNGDKLIDHTEKLNPTKASITHGCYDQKHHLWWFTTARGVVVWNGQQTVQLHSGNILTSDLSFSVATDHQGRIWIGQVQGVECIDLEERTVIHLGYDQGFQPVETNAGAVFTDSKGNVWFGTLTSATKIDVTKIGRDSTSGILRLREIEVNGKVYYAENYNDTAYPKLHLKYFENNLDFQFTSLCYTNAKDVKYSWKMEGVDKNWITKVNTREVNYSNLPPGDYTFKAMATNPNGFVTNEVNIKINIAKPFWNTVGFYLFEIAVFLFIVFLSFRFTRQSSNNRIGQIMTLLTIFIVFESGMLYISSYTDEFTNGVPVFQLVMNVLLAASLHPIEQKVQLFMKKWARKNKDKK